MVDGFPSEFSLVSIPLLKDIPSKDLDELDKKSRQIEFLPGESIIERGDTGQEVFFLLSGRVHVLNVASSGRVVAFAVLDEGEVFGELSALDGRNRSATVVAATQCTAATVPGDEFRRLITSNPKLSLALMQRLAYIIRNCDERIFNLSSLGAAQRVCLELLRLSHPDPGSPNRWIVYPVPTHAALAGTIDTTRETVARVFRRMYNQGIVERKAKTLYVRDRKRLEIAAMYTADG